MGQLKRVLVIGTGGSGKTEFARRLAQRTGLPLVHLDRLYWRAGWEPTPEPEWRERVQELIRGDSWIIDGNYGGTLALRLEACDTVFFLDLPRRTCLRRVVGRQLRHLGRDRPEMPPGCPERLNLEFLLWIWTYPARRRGEILRRLGELSGKKEIVILRTPGAVEEYLSSRI